MSVVMDQRGLSPRDGQADWKKLGEDGTQEQPPPNGPRSPCIMVGTDQSSGSLSWERFAPLSSGSWFIFWPVREMRRVSTRLCATIALHLLQVLSTRELCWDLPAMAFLVEVSRVASAASLRCLPALCPLVATAAWDSA